MSRTPYRAIAISQTCLTACHRRMIVRGFGGRDRLGVFAAGFFARRGPSKWETEVVWRVERIKACRPHRRRWENEDEGPGQG